MRAKSFEDARRELSSKLLKQTQASELVPHLLNRRSQVADKLDPGSVAVVTSSMPARRNGDNFYPYRQNSDFLYLAGIEKPRSVLVIQADGSTCLFIEEYDAHAARWDGGVLSSEQAKQDSGCDEVRTYKDSASLIAYLTQFSKLYVTSVTGSLRNQLNAAYKNGSVKLGNLRKIVSQLRWIKDSWEIDMMRLNCQLTALGHCNWMSNISNCVNEAEVQAYCDAMYTAAGASSSYEPIVAAGKNACILHYRENCQQLSANDLVLVDSGSEYAGYAGDVTRTVPASGKFNSQQKDLYEVVLQSQTAAIDMCKVGVSFNEPHLESARVICRGLKDLGIVKYDDFDVYFESGDWKKFYMHKCSHWLGLDVHDSSPNKEGVDEVKLVSGNVLTIEPGVYLDSDEVASKWYGMGIRIEDDILVTEEHPENFTQLAPRSVNEIEQLTHEQLAQRS